MEDKIKSTNTIAFDNYHLKFNTKKLSGKYGCSVLFNDGKSQNEIRYKLDISIKDNLESGGKIFVVDRENKIFVNDVIQNDFIDKLALETSKCLYPLHLKTKRNGKLIEILNFDAILSRWEQTKVNLREDYKSGLTEKYIKATEKSLLSKDILLKKISKDWFINLYFNSFYKFYSQDLYIDEKLSYPILGNAKPVKYKVKSKIQLNEDTKDIRLDINGNIDDERCALDLEQKLDHPHYKNLNEEEEPLPGTCNLIYLFDGKTGIIEAIEAKFETEFSIPKKILVKLFLLKELNESNAFVVEDNQEDNKKERKIGLWSKLFRK
ncbi:hypothetical protein [Lacinutrix chionoecetis]